MSERIQYSYAVRTRNAQGRCGHGPCDQSKPADDAYCPRCRRWVDGTSECPCGSHATLLSALEALLDACLTTKSDNSIKCVVCGVDSWYAHGVIHDPEMPCGRAAAAIAEAKGEA